MKPLELDVLFILSLVGLVVCALLTFLTFLAFDPDTMLWAVGTWFSYRCCGAFAVLDKLKKAGHLE